MIEIIPAEDFWRWHSIKKRRYQQEQNKMFRYYTYDRLNHHTLLTSRHLDKMREERRCKDSGTMLNSKEFNVLSRDRASRSSLVAVSQLTMEVGNHFMASRGLNWQITRSLRLRTPRLLRRSLLLHLYKIWRRKRKHGVLSLSSVPTERKL